MLQIKARLMRRGYFICALLGLGLAQAAAAQPLVAVEKVREDNWRQTLSLYGTLTSPRDADISPRTAGLVAETHVDAGDRVAQGDVLITLDRELARLTLRESEASVAQARAQLAEAKRLQAEVERLSGTGAVSETELESRAAEVEVARADLARLRAQAARQRELLERHRVIAPFPGLVRDRLIEPGEYVSESTPVVELVSTDRLRMDVRAPQQYFGSIKPGMAVTIRPDAFAGRSFEAKVDVTVPASDPQSRTFLTRIFLDNSEGLLTPGMSAQVHFQIETEEQIIVVSRDALVRQPSGGVRVWVIAESDDGLVARERQIRVGRTADGRAEVLEGLTAGDRVVVRGNETLNNGDAVRIEDKGS